MSDDLTNSWIDTLEKNLALLEEEKKTKLKGIILNMREELRNIWDKLHFSQEQRDKFEPCYVEMYTESVCTAHEDEIKRLNEYYNQVFQFSILKVIPEPFFRTRKSTSISKSGK